MALGPKSIRGKVTLAATAATAIAMLLILGITGYAMQQILTSVISSSLDERLDSAQAEVAAGNYQAAIDLAGEEMMQIIDAQGNILAETPNARGLAAIVVDDDDEAEVERGKKFDTLEFERADDDDNDMASVRESQQGAQSNSGSQNESSSTPNAGKNSTEDTGASSGSGVGLNASTNGSAGQTGNTTSRPARTPRASYDDDDDDDDDDDAAEEAREAAEKAAEEAQERAEKEAEAAREREEEAREAAEEAAEKAREREAAKAPARQAAEVDNDDDDEDDDADEDDDDDDDDDDNKKAGKAKKLAFPFFIQMALFSTASASAASAADAARSAADTGASSNAASSIPVAQKNPAAYIDATDIFGDDGPYLVKKRQVNSPDGSVTLAAITSLASASRTAQLATQLLATIFLALLCLVVAFTWNMAARTLQPVEQMRRTAESITSSNLSERIPVPTRDKDLSRLATTFNELLARVEASFNEQRRFVSDASHELKSPVAATGIMLETLRAHPEAVDSEQVVADLTTENDRLASIVGDLLTLARSDEGRMKLDAKPIDLMDVLLNEAAGVQGRSAVPIDTSAVQPVICAADAELLSHSVRNLLENAVRYAKTIVKVSCVQQDNAVLITISDDGCGIVEQDRERVFDRFVSLEDARANPTSTGLGLPVARSMVERHGGTLAFVEPELGGATALIRLPLS